MVANGSWLGPRAMAKFPTTQLGANRVHSLAEEQRAELIEIVALRWTELRAVELTQREFDGPTTRHTRWISTDAMSQ